MKHNDVFQTLTEEDFYSLTDAVRRIQNKSVTKSISDIAARPFDKALNRLPKPIKRNFERMTEKMVIKCLDIAIVSTQKRGVKRRFRKSPRILSAAVGGLSGMLGIAGLPVELPITTYLILRAITDIAQSNGEDLTAAETRIACIEIFALGMPAANNGQNIDYYSSRALFKKFSGDAIKYFAERGLVRATSPLVGGFISETAARYSFFVSERAAASAVPIAGAVGSAALNILIMKYFQNIAFVHFTIRRLERKYGQEVVQGHYEKLASG